MSAVGRKLNARRAGLPSLAGLSVATVVIILLSALQSPTANSPSEQDQADGGAEVQESPTPAATTTRATVLPGGGREVFPHRRFVSLYGHPGVPGLGALGQQDAAASIDRVRALAEQYQQFSPEPVIPSLEVIATVASSEPGLDGDYSNESTVEELEKLVKMTESRGVYVVLDFQPGRAGFLSQMKRYRRLLSYPHVGVGLDPEWKLTPRQKPLQQIGSAQASEVNEASAWLAGIVRDEGLPQKVFILHQFQIRMLPDRAKIVQSPQLATVLHADGQGSRGDKNETWQALKKNLPGWMWLGWKNFYREDPEILSPEQTMKTVTPTPWFISYQ